MIIQLERGDTLPANDRIALYGDGCFTTMAVESNRIELLNCHMQRLQQSCRRLQIDFSDWTQLQATLVKLASQYEGGVLKAVISRGQGGRGYDTQGVINSCCYLSYSTMPEHYPSLRAEGLKLGLSTVQLAKQPLLAGIKHLNRLEQVLVKLAMHETGCDDMVVCDTDGYVIETSSGNLFWRLGKDWFTADLTNSGVKGVMRNHVIDVMRTNQLNIVEITSKPEAILKSDEMFVCNSLMKIIPVSQLDFESHGKTFEQTQGSFINWFVNHQSEVNLHV
ncbi:aminodeoxychorismate lyase [Aliiglaciecola sp. LCG003]|uniref:aminodeoxychorismate lyase n=1 Tax=Aliiglaciecola sp. LCG003 TaxID=3053655 RepID=UPI00257365C6|nr:aminodeoxychorismate lyase [Aliiglaciecola sp. LCG003]WJG07740.1 aminodeoxychorismate lyase [Aliiglaciecola sp. LCG003]